KLWSSIAIFSALFVATSIWRSGIFRKMDAPIIVANSDVLVQGHENSPRGTFVGKETEGIRFERNEREVTRSGDRLRRLGFKGEHTARHANGGGNEQITLTAHKIEDFLDFDRAHKDDTE